MLKEYRTIQEVAGPLMMVSGVENVTYDELGEIILANGQTRRCRVLDQPFQPQGALPWTQYASWRIRGYAWQSF